MKISLLKCSNSAFHRNLTFCALNLSHPKPLFMWLFAQRGVGSASLVNYETYHLVRAEIPELHAQSIFIFSFS